MICVFEVTAGPKQGERIELRKGEHFEIGRISTADLSIPSDRFMSRHHLVVEGIGDHFRVRDVGSANGTYVNGKQISRIELCNGDEVKAGESTFRVTLTAHQNAPQIARRRNARESLAASADAGHGPSDAASDSNAMALADQSAAPQDENSCVERDEFSTQRQPHDGLAKQSRIPNISWWEGQQFGPTSIPSLFSQPSNGEEQPRLSQWFSSLPPDAAVLACLNTDSASEDTCRGLANLREADCIRHETNDLCFVTRPTPENRDQADAFLDLLETNLGLDRLTIFVTDYPLLDVEINRLAQWQPQPSKLRKQLLGGDRLNALDELDGIVLFEQEASRRLSLVMLTD